MAFYDKVVVYWQNKLFGRENYFLLSFVLNFYLLSKKIKTVFIKQLQKYLILIFFLTDTLQTWAA